jgi:Fe-S cluster biogenesis protein NfuA
VNSNGIKTVNYIKPIVTEGICLSCHGSENTISDNVKQILSKKYPEDKAVGYSIGDLRGIISISKEIK